MMETAAKDLTASDVLDDLLKGLSAVDRILETGLLVNVQLRATCDINRLYVALCSCSIIVIDWMKFYIQ